MDVKITLVLCTLGDRKNQLMRLIESLRSQEFKSFEIVLVDQNAPVGYGTAQTTGNTTKYVYADPVVCNCLYIGDQKAYGAYRQDVLAKKIADEQQMAAMTYQDSWDWGRWDWGPWGGGWWR